MKYHLYSLDNLIKVVLVEPIPHEYVWLSFYMHRRFRNGALSKELAKHLLYVLKGVHHIHWLSGLTTFRQLARELDWSTRRKSPFFQDCRASTTISLPSAPACYPLFQEILKHEKPAECPYMANFESEEDTKEILRLIEDHFSPKKKIKVRPQKKKVLKSLKPRRRFAV